MFYKRGIDGKRPLRISFSGVHGEIGIDAGGPRREFFQMLAHHMASEAFGFFEGSSPNLLPTMKGPSLRLGHFKIIGTMIAHSIINGGMCPFILYLIFYMMQFMVDAMHAQYQQMFKLTIIITKSIFLALFLVNN